MEKMQICVFYHDLSCLMTKSEDRAKMEKPHHLGSESRQENGVRKDLRDHWKLRMVGASWNDLCH